MRLSREVKIVLFRGLFCASVVYLAVMLTLMHGWFGIAQDIWAIICIIGSWRALKAAQAETDKQ
jgi:hypothetical protein